MSTPAWPPADISPTELFETWLPAEAARLRAAHPDAPAPDVSADVTVTGEGGGSWRLASRGGEFSVTAGAEGSADLGVELSVDVLRAALDPDGGLIPRDAANAAAANPIDLMRAGPLVEQARSLAGRLTFCLTGFRGTDLALALTFGGAATPESTISVGADVMEQIRSGALPPAQAYFSGQILIEGDPAFAMQVAMSMMAAGQR